MTNLFLHGMTKYESVGQDASGFQSFHPKDTEHLWRGEHVARFLRLTLFNSASWLPNTLVRQDQHAQVEVERRKWLEENFGGKGTLADLFHWQHAIPGKSPLGGDIK